MHPQIQEFEESPWTHEEKIKFLLKKYTPGIQEQIIAFGFNIIRK
jgi:hypothetical protein